MSTPLKTYLGTGSDKHTGTSGFTNYFNNKPNPTAVFADFPDAVIVDGSDDWCAALEARPAMVVDKAGIVPLAWFHSGISGITKSGVVLTEAQFAQLDAYYRATFEQEVNDLNTVYRRDPAYVQAVSP